MTCQTYQQLFSAYLDRELPAREKAEVAVHALECANCQTELRLLLEVKILLRAQPMPSMPEDLRSQIEAATFAKPSWYKELFARRWWVPALALTAALGGWLFMRLHKGSPRGIPLETLVAEHRKDEQGVPLAKHPRIAWHRSADIQPTEQ